MRGSRHDDDEEFVEFVRAASRRLIHTAYLMTGNRHRAEDAAQTALRTYASWSRIREKDAYGYARAALVNHLIDRWRRPMREYATEELPDSPVGDVATPSSAASPAAPTVSAPAPVEPREPLGAVVTSGIWYDKDQRIYYFVPVDLPGQPGVTIGLVAGRRTAGGALTSDYLVNDFQGSDRRPGFHQIGYDPDGGVTGAPIPTFGYFVGPAALIVGTAGGRKITAQRQTWSKDPRVVVFWFHPKLLPPGERLDGISAWDARGRKL